MLIVAMVKQYILLTIVRHIGMLPIWNGFVRLQSAIICADALGLVVLNPPLRTMLLGHRHSVHRQFHATWEEFGNLSLSRELDAPRHAICLSHLLKILFHWHIGTEVQVVLQAVAINIPHTVEIARSKPLCFKDFLWARTTNSIQEQALKLIVADTVLLARTDIVVVLPKLLWHLIAAHALQQSSAVFHCRPFQHTTDRHVEHDRVVVLQYSRIEDT